MMTTIHHPYVVSRVSTSGYKIHIKAGVSLYEATGICQELNGDRPYKPWVTEYATCLKSRRQYNHIPT